MAIEHCITCGAELKANDNPWWCEQCKPEGAGEHRKGQSKRLMDCNHLPPRYYIMRYAGRYYATFQDPQSDKTYVLDARGYYAGLVEHGKPAWPGAFREPRAFSRREGAARFIANVETPGWAPRDNR